MKANKKQFIFYILITAAFFSFEAFGLLLQDMSDAAIAINLMELMRILAISFGYTILFGIICFGINRLLKKHVELNNSLANKLLSNQWLLMLVFLIAWLPCFLAYYPAIYSYDGEPQLIQYTTAMFDNHHPVFHTLIMGWCYDFGRFVSLKLPFYFDGMALYSVIQMLFLSYSFSEVMVLENKLKTGRQLQLITLFFFALYPVHPLMAISTTKDTLFTGCIVILIVCLWRMLSLDRLTVKETVILYIKLVFSLVLLMLLRRNGVYITCGLLIAILCTFLIKTIKKKKIVLAGLIFLSFVIFKLSDAVLMSSTGAIQGESAEALSIPLQQIARSYKSNSMNMTQDEKEEIFRYLPDEGIQNYRPYISDGVKQRFNNEAFQNDPKGFIKMWIDVIKKYPGSSILATLYNTMGLWFPSDISHTEVYKDWWRDRTSYMITDANPVFVAMKFVKKENFIPSLRNCYESFATDCNYRNMGIVSPILILIFSPAVFCLMTIFVFLKILFVSKNKQLAIVILPLMINLMTIFAGPCVLVRYVYPLMCSVPVLLCLLKETYGN